VAIDRSSGGWARLPKHRNPPAPNPVACAPYNFVPLPERIVAAVEAATSLPSHDTYANPDFPHTGYFDVALTTRSPLYVRGALSRAQFERRGLDEGRQAGFRDQVKNAPAFFSTERSGEPSIPGSSLRGMLRNLLEIVSYGKLQPVTDQNLFYRSVDNSRLGIAYRARMVGNDRARAGENKVEAGFLRKTRQGYVIAVTRKLQVRRDLLRLDLLVGSGPGAVPNWAHQHRRVFVQLARDGRHVERWSPEPGPDLIEGRLVITGPAPKKSHEFVLVVPSPGAESIQVSDDLIARFEDDDQITQWQERAFPRDRPATGSRARNGTVERLGDDPGEPVFFLRENGALTFFGRAGMFRLPYLHAPRDLIPLELRRPDLVDYAEAIFGYVKPPSRQGNAGAARAGRVSVTDARLEPGQGDVWLSAEPIVPKILATPKPTAFQHYLVQGDVGGDALRHYDDDLGTTALRGHKLYWHQGERQRSDLEPNPAHGDVPGAPNSTQHTQIQPVKAGVSFSFRVYFENVLDRELGALCWTLQPLGDPARTYCHGLGMGKPLGMGAVQLTATLHLTDRRRRYSTLFSGDDWETGKSGPGEPLSELSLLEQRAEPFERHVLETLGMSPGCTHLFELKRVGMLLKLLEWPGVAPRFSSAPDDRRRNSRTMRLEEFKQRAVLPDPADFGELTGTAEPGPAGRSLPPAGPPPAPSKEKTAGQRAPEVVRPAGPVPTPPRAEPSPAPVARRVRPGEKIPATVVQVDEYRFRVRLHTAHEEEINVELQPAARQWIKTGLDVSVRVGRVDPKTGRVKEGSLVL